MYLLLSSSESLNLSYEVEHAYEQNTFSESCAASVYEHRNVFKHL